jgi:hypothetical protein
MDVDDARPFSLEGEYQSFGEAFPSVASLTVMIRAVNLVRDTVEMRQYGERDVPSHVDCPNCGYEAAVGWSLAEVVDRGETEFRVTQACDGLERVGRGCPYGFELEGTVEYV